MAEINSGSVGGTPSQHDQLLLQKQQAKTDAQETGGPKKETTMGNLNGENLKLGTVKGEAAATQSTVVPVLTAPNMQSTTLVMERALGNLNKSEVRMSAQSKGYELGVLADALAKAEPDGKGNVKIGLEGTPLKQFGKLKGELYLKNTTPEQAKDLGKQLNAIAYKLFVLDQADSTEWKHVEKAIVDFQKNIMSENVKVENLQMEVEKIDNMLETGKSFQFDTKSLHVMMELDRLMPDAMPEDMASGLAITDSGYEMEVDGSHVSINFAEGGFALNVDGQNVEVKNIGDPDSMSMSVDGVSKEFDTDEVKTLTDFFAIMAMFHEMGTEMRKKNREGRAAAQETVVSKIKAQAQKQREAAHSNMVAGMISGSAKVAGGLMTTAGGIKGMKADRAAAKAGTNDRPGQMVSARYTGLGSMLEGTGEVLSASYRYQASMSEAEGTVLRAHEEAARFVKQTEQDQMEVAKELTQKARDAFAQVWSSYIQTQQRIAGNI